MRHLTTALAAAVLVAAPMPVLDAQTQQAAPQVQAPPSGSSIVQKIIVKVNGEILTQTELEQLQIQALRSMPNVQQLTSNEALQQALGQVTPGVLLTAVNDLLLVQRGKELGYRLSDDRFQETIDNVKAENNLTDESLAQALRDEGMTMAEYRSMMERTLIKQAVTSEEIIGTPNLTEAEMRTYYRGHPDEFQIPATVTLREIFVPVATTGTGAQMTYNAAEDQAAREKVAAARERILAGEDAVAVVNEVSEGATKATGGLIGPVNLGDINPAIGNAVGELGPGQVTEPIRMQNGYHVFMVDTRTESATAAFEDVREQIYQSILLSRVDAESEKYLQRLRAQAVIEWKDESARQQYEQALASMQQAGG